MSKPEGWYYDEDGMLRVKVSDKEVVGFYCESIHVHHHDDLLGTPIEIDYLTVMRALQEVLIKDQEAKDFKFYGE